METLITKLDGPAVRYIAKRLTEAVEPMAKELGMVIDVGSCRYGENNGRFQLKIALLDSSGKAISEDVELFNNNAKLFGFEPNDLGREFAFRGQSYTICGLSPKSRKYPVIAQSQNGKNYKFPCRIVLDALNKKTPDWLKDSLSGSCNL